MNFNTRVSSSLVCRELEKTRQAKMKNLGDKYHINAVETHGEGDGACFGISLAMAMRLRTHPTNTLLEMKEYLTSKDGKSNSCWLQNNKLKNINFKDHPVIRELIFGSLISDAYFEILTKIPSEEIKDNFIKEGIYSETLDSVELYSRLTNFDDKILIQYFALPSFSEGEGHAVLVFSSNEKDKHFYMDPNQGLFSFSSKEALAEAVPKLIGNKYPDLDPARCRGFLAINSSPKQ